MLESSFEKKRIAEQAIKSYARVALQGFLASGMTPSLAVTESWKIAEGMYEIETGRLKNKL